MADPNDNDKETAKNIAVCLFHTSLTQKEAEDLLAKAFMHLREQAEKNSKEIVTAYEDALVKAARRIVFFKEIDGPVIHQECREFTVEMIREEVAPAYEAQREETRRGPQASGQEAGGGSKEGG